MLRADNWHVAVFAKARPVGFLARLLSLLLRLVLVLAGLVFGAVVLVAGLVFAAFIVIWGLLRGRRPQVMRFRTHTGSPFGDLKGGPAFGGMGRAAPRGDVVDIEAREIPDTPQQLPPERS